MIVPPRALLLPVIRPVASRYVVTPEEDVEEVPVIRPWASRQVVWVLRLLEVPVILP